MHVLKTVVNTRSPNSPDQMLQQHITGLHVSLKQHYYILGHCEQIHTNEHHLTRLPCKEGKEEIKDNPQAYTIHKGIGENNTNPTVHYPMWAWKI